MKLQDDICVLISSLILLFYTEQKNPQTTMTPDESSVFVF